MSQSSDALLEGFGALLDTAGEPLTLLRVGGVTVPVYAILDRTPDPKRYSGKLNFDLDGASVIEINRDALDPIAKAGETFTDGRGMRHKISRVHPLDDTLLCICTTS